jgi:Flp pilus assembly pilin Flp
MTLLKRFVREESGLEGVEYAVMVALVVAGIAVAVPVLTGAIKAKFQSIASDQLG